MPFIESAGQVVNDYAVAADYPDARAWVTPSTRWITGGERETSTLVSFTAPNAVVTSAYVPIDVEKGRLFLNQTYSNARSWFGMRAQFDGDSYSFAHEAHYWPGRHVVLGGPIDGVWFHWLMSWAPRLVVLRELHPEIYDDPATRFFIHSSAGAQPFRAILRALGIAEHRISYCEHTVDHLLEEAVLVSFLDQEVFYPEVIAAFVRTVRAGFGQAPAPARRRRIFCSRQGFTIAKRRVTNYEAILPILTEFGFESVRLGECTAEEQVRLFTEAEAVVGVHGADLANLIFCQPGARVLLLENDRNVAIGLAKTMSTLADICGLPHRQFLVQEQPEPGVDYSQFGHLHNQDYAIDPAAFREALRLLLA